MTEPRHAGETRELRAVDYRPKRLAKGETPDPEPRADERTVAFAAPTLPKPGPRHDTTGANAIPAVQLVTPHTPPASHIATWQVSRLALRIGAGIVGVLMLAVAGALFVAWLGSRP